MDTDSLDLRKREKILDICYSYPMEGRECPDCPLNYDSQAWCKVGLMRDISSGDLDTIIEKMTTSKEDQYVSQT